MWYFWPLCDVRSLRGDGLIAERFEIEGTKLSLDPARVILFADVLIDAPSYGFFFDPRSEYHGWVFGSDGAGNFISAKSMDEFFSKFFKHHEDVLLVLEE
jgi:hypothetical protein